VVPNRPKPFSALPPLQPARLQSSVQDVPGIGHNGGPALSDADIISEVLTRGLQSAVAALLPVQESNHAAHLEAPTLRPLRPLAVPVRTAAEMLGVGISSTWLLIGELQLDVIHPVPGRTVVTVASLEKFVATLSARSRFPQQMTEERIAEDRLPIQQAANSGNYEGNAKARRPRSRPNGTTGAKSDSESDK
jgi:hypothetical protein